MFELTATVRNSAGIHCRPSTLIVERVRGFDAEITVRSGDQTCDLRSVMGLLMLQLQEGSKVTVQVDGPDEAQVCRAMVELFETRFDFPPRTD